MDYIKVCHFEDLGPQGNGPFSSAQQFRRQEYIRSVARCSSVPLTVSSRSMNGHPTHSLPFTEATAMTESKDSKLDPVGFLANSGLARRLVSLKATDTSSAERRAG